MPVDSEGRGGEGRIVRGWRLTLAAWSLMRRDRTMIYLALLGAVCGIAGAGLILWAGGYFSAAPGSRAPLGLVSLVALYPLTFVGVFINVARREISIGPTELNVDRPARPYLRLLPE